jgi:thiol-disulfide isomerase/thioredoxin
MKVLMFSAQWCSACKSSRPFVEKEVERLGIQFEYVDVDIDSGAELSEKYNVRSLPTLVGVDSEGVEVGRAVGNMAWKDIESWVK